jgi:hypothetical protein
MCENNRSIFRDSLLIREHFDIRDPFAISKPVKVGSAITLSNKIIDLGVRAGIRQREKLPKNAIHQGSSFRKSVPVAQGFRKFFTTQLVNSKVNPEIRDVTRPYYRFSIRILQANG